MGKLIFLKFSALALVKGIKKQKIIDEISDIFMPNILAGRNIKVKCEKW
jgi:hypothetical protein